MTPAILPDSAGSIDFFCVGDPGAAAAAGWPVVDLHDGWYADDLGGGAAIWGHGKFWEVRDTPFHVTQACGAADAMALLPGAEKRHDDAAASVNVRNAIFRG